MSDAAGRGLVAALAARSPDRARARALVVGVACAVALLGAGCGVESGDPIDVGPGGETSVPKRRGTLVVESCAPDGYQLDVLAGAPARATIQEVVLVCPTLDQNGAIQPSDATSRAALATLVGQLHADGYSVSFGVGAQDSWFGTASTPSPASLATRFEQTTFTDAAVASIAAFATIGDGVDLALPPIDTSAKAYVTQFVAELATRVRPQARLGLFAPPSYSSPSDIPDADVWDLTAIAPNLDRVRLMTVDYSCCGAPAGPTTDPGWAAQVLKVARRKAPNASFDLTLPLYGWDFSGAGATSLGYLDAQALAQVHGATPSRTAIGELTFSYVDANGRAHSVWYDDATSLLRDLRAWDPATVPGDVGVAFYGLGAEDPGFLPALAGASP